VILILKPILDISFFSYPKIILVTEFVKNRFWEDMMILLSRESLSLSLNFLLQKLLGMGPLWNGYVIIYNISFPSLHICHVNLLSFCHLISYLFDRLKISRTQMSIIGMFHICLAYFRGTQ
jgi:hypothetical protein